MTQSIVKFYIDPKSKEEFTTTFRRLTKAMQKVTPLQFGNKWAKFANEFIQERKQMHGYPQVPHTPLKVRSTLLQKGKSGSSAMIWASGKSAKGFEYAYVQEFGYPNERYAKSKRGMTFLSPSGKWVRSMIFQSIPKMGYMEFTRKEAAKDAPQYFAKVINKILKTKGKFRESTTNFS